MLKSFHYNNIHTLSIIFFAEFCIKNINIEKIQEICLKNDINIRYHKDSVSISFDETTTIHDFVQLC